MSDDPLSALIVCFLGELNQEEAIRLLNEHPELLQETLLDDPWLVVAARQGCVDVCKYLLKVGVDVNERGKDLYPLESAINGDSPEIAALLLENGADPNLGRTLLAAARQSNRLKFAEMLIKHNVDVNQTFEIFGDSENLKTALDWSSSYPEFAALLRDAGALTIEELKTNK